MGLSRVQFSGRRLMVAVAIVGGLMGGCVASYLGLQRLEAWGVAVHMRSTAYELTRWEREYASVRNLREAERAIGMLQYAGDYYRPIEGYRSHPRTEAALEEQRTRTLRAIATALRAYSGKDFGANVIQWRTWAAQQERSIPNDTTHATVAPADPRRW